MNKYSEWTDDQINIEVHKRYKNECFYNKCRQVARVGYCNDWGHAGPLMQEVEIFINWSESEFEDKSRALRAAMEVYLMMSEGE